MNLRLIGILLIAGGIASPQTVPVSRFEFVASIKPHKPSQTNSPGRVGMSFSGMRASTEGMTAYGLIGFAHDLRIDGLTGGPHWAETDSFDLEIKVGGDTAPTRDQFRQVFKALLSDRFKLSVHQTTEEKNIYALVVAKNGPKFTESAADARSRMSMTGSNYIEMIVSKWTMGQLARQLSSEAGRPVLDKTGLTGSYDYKLAWTGDVNGNPQYAPLIVALQEQLGLKLESQKAPVETLVIDRIEKPSEN
jgi:uncharacterized protein (TIGR03435 family)